MTPTRYSAPLRLFHWLMAVAIVIAVLIGFYVNELPGDWRKSAWVLHQSLGVTVGLMLPLRLWFRFSHRQPALPPMAKIEAFLARFTHVALYAAMIMMVVTGYGMKALAGKVTPWFGLKIAPFLPLYPELAKLARHWHEPFALFLVALVALHVVGALKHRVVDKVPIFQRII